MVPLAANLAWHLSSLPAGRQYQRAAARPAQSQARLLMEMIQANADTEFGRKYRFSDIQTVADFQGRVPLLTYEAYAGDIDRIGAGEQGILTREPVLLMEPTSGSTAATKLIPVTATLKKQFWRAISPWITNLFSRRPGLLGGPAYWSVSPIDGIHRYTPGGLPIGFEDDTDYLGRGGRWLQSILAVPSLVKHICDIDTFRYISLLFLVRSPDLRLISVWNPTFFLMLLDGLDRWGDRLVGDLRAGTINPPGVLDDAIRKGLTAGFGHRLAADPGRARAVAQALNQNLPERTRTLWPRVGLLSSWADAAAQTPAKTLAAALPHAHFQAKGLIATEAFVSLPLSGRPGAAMAISSHFFEFLSDAGDVRLAHQLEQGERYRVVVTTGGGLYRYQLMDEIESLGGLQIKFIGRGGDVSDLFGEKVNAGHVARIFEYVFKSPPAFATLSPETYAAGAIAYTLFTTTPVSEQKLEEALCENYHYAYCRRLGQLVHARVFVVGRDGPERYFRACRARGQRLGDIKPAILYRPGGLREFFIDGERVTPRD